MKRFALIILGLLVALVTLGPAAAGRGHAAEATFWGLDRNSEFTAGLQIPVCPASINFNETITCSIDTAGEVDSYTFSGTSGDRVRVRVVETSGVWTATQELLRPDGTTLPSSACDGFTNPTTAEELTCDLDAMGSHTILIKDSFGTETGSYNVYLQRLSNPVGCATLSFGASPTPGSISVAAEVDCFTFSAASGDRVRVRVVETSGVWTATQELLRPDGTTLPSSACDGFTNPTTAEELTCDLDAMGSHTILIKDSFGTETGSYNVNLICLTQPCGVPSPVGGIAEPPDIAEAMLRVPDSSDRNVGAVAGLIAGVTASALAGGAAWYARRRWL